MAGGIHPPLSVLQQWATISNPEHPTQQHGWGLAVLCIVLFILTSVTVFARLYARYKVRNTAGIDDIVIVCAMVPTLGLAIATALASRLYGFDRHVWDLSSALAINSRKATLAMETCYIASTGLTKISILLFYRRMTQGTVSPVFRGIVHASIASVAAYMIAFLLVPCVGCRPLDAFWMQAEPQWARTHVPGVDYICLDEGAMLLAACGISIAQDFLACGLPLMVFWKLQLPKRQKIALGAIFSVGFFLCITGILRMYYVHQIFYTTYDVTWVAYDAWIWTSVEAHVAIICASAPALKTFVKKYLKTWSSRTGWMSYVTGRTRNTGHIHDHASGANSRGSRLLDSKHLEMGGINVTKSVQVESRAASVSTEPKSPIRLSDEESSRPATASGNKFTWLIVEESKDTHDV